MSPGSALMSPGSAAQVCACLAWAAVQPADPPILLCLRVQVRLQGPRVRTLRAVRGKQANVSVCARGHMRMAPLSCARLPPLPALLAAGLLPWPALGCQQLAASHLLTAQPLQTAPPLQAVPLVLAEFTERAVNTKRRLLHTLLPFLPAASAYTRGLKVRCLLGRRIAPTAQRVLSAAAWRVAAGSGLWVASRRHHWLLDSLGRRAMTHRSFGPLRYDLPQPPYAPCHPHLHICIAPPSAAVRRAPQSAAAGAAGRAAGSAGGAAHLRPGAFRPGLHGVAVFERQRTNSDHFSDHVVPFFVLLGLLDQDDGPGSLARRL